MLPVPLSQDNPLKSEIKEEIIEEKAWLIHDFISENDCKSLIEASEEHLNYESVFIKNRHVHRHCYRAKFEDERLTKWIFSKVKPILPEYNPSWLGNIESEEFHQKYKYIPVGCYSIPSFVKYTKSRHQFEKHYDYSIHNDDLRSFLTLMIYLNSSFKGGNTNFLDSNTEEITHSIEPQPGLAIMFLQDKHNNLLHEGERTSDGTKYILRFEIMYKMIEK